MQYGICFVASYYLSKWTKKSKKTLEQIHIHVIYVVHKIEKILQDVTARTLSMKTEKVWLGLG